MLNIKGVNFDEFCDLVFDYINANNYDNIILNRFENYTTNDINHPYASMVNQVHEYAYGWEHDHLIDDSEISTHPIFKDIKVYNYGSYSLMYTDGVTHSELVLIDDWMTKLHKDYSTVNIAGHLTENA